VVVPDDAAAALRLEDFVRANVPGLSRRLARAAIAAGDVRVNGARAAKGTLVAPGDEVTLPEWHALVPEPELALAVVHEDGDLVAVDKPGGMPGHALDPRERGTAVAFLLARWPEMAEVGDPLAPGLVHRLDTGTSGLLVAARTPDAHAALRTAFSGGAVEKRYMAVVAGIPPRHARVSLALARDRRDRRRMRAAAGARGWQAVTEFELLSSAGDRALVAATMHTGVTHQIRVHLAELGHPVLGDALYGGPDVGLRSRRHALHATGLRFRHPSAGDVVELSSPLPADLRALLVCQL